MIGHALALFTIPNMLKKLYDRIARNEVLIRDSSLRQTQQYGIQQSRFEEILRQAIEQQTAVLRRMDLEGQNLAEQQATILKKLDLEEQNLAEQQSAVLKELDIQKCVLADIEEALGEMRQNMEDIHMMQQVLKDTVQIYEEQWNEREDFKESFIRINGMLAQLRDEQKSAESEMMERLKLMAQPLKECRQMQTAGLAIDTAISEKMDMQADISSSISKKLDELPAFIATNNISSHTAVIGIPGGIIGVIADGFTMGVPAEEWGVAMYLSQVGHFEVGTERFFEMLLKPGMTVLDLGANLGMFTLRALRAGCKVFSYEPTPRTSEILRQNIKVNGFAESGRSYVMQMAVSDVCGSTKLFKNPKMCGHNSLFGGEEEMQQSVTVETVTLDSQQDLLGPVDIIKMDIEGAEYYALYGMRTLLEKNPHVQMIMEFAPIHLKRAGVQPEALLKMVRELGFSIYTINETTAEAETVSEEELLRTGTVNLYLKREG